MSAARERLLLTAYVAPVDAQQTSRREGAVVADPAVEPRTVRKIQGLFDRTDRSGTFLRTVWRGSGRHSTQQSRQWPVAAARIARLGGEQDNARLPGSVRRRTGVVQPVPDMDILRRSSCHLVVPTGQTAVLPWTYDRMGQPAARAAAAWHSAGLGARLPVRRVRTRVPAFRVRPGIARAAESSRSAAAPQAGCRHPRPAGTGGEPVRVPRVRRAAPSAVPQPGLPPAFRADAS
jgi:hypothetical protein